MQTLVRTIKTLPLRRVSFLVVLGGLASASPLIGQSQAHIGHVGEAWRDTPEGVGLLPAAQMEAEVAEAHAGYAASSDELARVKGHIGHVMHAIDPSSTEGGPGKGYGLVKAAKGAAAHIKMAGEADDATESATLHSNHVHTAASNVAMWAESIQELAAQVQASNDLATAKDLATQIHHMTQMILNGTDANEDGRIGWQEGEGGLAQAARHLELIGS